MFRDELIIAQINEIKKAIDGFCIALESYSKKTENEKIFKNELGFFRFISKQIIFLKNIYDCEHDYKIKVIISDFYNYIVCIIKKEHRYMYVNERSIIENYTRWIVSTDVEKNHITTQVFEELKNKTNLSDLDYSRIKSEYVTSCGYIHGSKLLNENLSYVFNECITNDLKIKNINKYFDNIKYIVKTYNRLIISTYPNLIDECFYRRKSVLKYLLGDDLLEFLFSKIT